MAKKLVSLEAGKFYHIYNRGNNRDKIFFNSENYNYFLKLFNKYLSDFLHVYAFCLLPNHFHFLVHVKEPKEHNIPSLANVPHFIKVSSSAKVPPFQKVELLCGKASTKPFEKISSPAIVPPFEKVEQLYEEKDFSNQVSFQFRKFFTAYSMAINKQQHRTGSLFQKNFKRIEITTERYLKQLIIYIHTNPQLHGFVKDYTIYRWSSFEINKNNFSISIDYNFLLSLFDNQENYHLVHQQKIDYARLKNFLIEDE